MIEPIFEKEFDARGYGFWPGMGCKDTLRRVDELLKRGYVVDISPKSFFANVRPSGSSIL